MWFQAHSAGAAHGRSATKPRSVNVWIKERHAGCAGGQLAAPAMPAADPPRMPYMQAPGMPTSNPARGTAGSRHRRGLRVRPAGAWTRADLRALLRASVRNAAAPLRGLASVQRRRAPQISPPEGRTVRHVRLHVAEAALLPSSHSSLAWTMPSPQKGPRVQSALQPL